jgi:hypothetical protein
LLNAAQLAAYIHLPSLEVPGFWIDLIPRFDVSVRGNDETVPRLILGSVVAYPSGNHGRDILTSPATGASGSAPQTSQKRAQVGPPYSVSLAALSRHLFIAGVTGTGKTNTCLRLLRGLHAQGVPFLVIEPAKREYRELALATTEDLGSEPLARQLVVYSAASDEGAPFRINPFEVENGTTIAEHVDLLRAVFSASFGDMWTPLPQVLEQCMVLVYQNRGWDLFSDRNHRLAEGEDRALAFPTLRELAASVDEIVDGLGFDPEARDRVRGSLATRINGLRVGSKGALFDTRHSLSMSSLLERPTILELERLADESDKAFLMGLLFIRLVEFRRGQRRAAQRGSAPGDALQHMLVIEEAHRLLTNVGVGNGAESSARAQAVESFSNLLAEIRAYGQGITVVDQVPTKLASDVVKNTNLKIAHRIVDEADRKLLGGSMSMSPGQLAGLASLARGEAAVFGDGDDAPVLVYMTGPPDPASTFSVTEETRNSPNPLPLHWECACTGKNYAAPECVTASNLSEQSEIRHGILRIATSALHAYDVDELPSFEILERLRQEGASGNREALVIGCLAARGAEWLADVWGAHRSWPFSDTLNFALTLRWLLEVALGTISDGRDATQLSDALMEYQAIAKDLHVRTIDPYPNCSAICTGELAGSCLYRHAVASTLRRPDILGAWTHARTNDPGFVDHYRRTWQLCVNEVASEVLGPSAQPQAKRAVALCFAQQALAAESPSWPPWTRAQVVGLLATGFADAITADDQSDGIASASTHSNEQESL